ncbi:MAG TPA: sigma-54 dependent transcriptional regulator [Candidatus Polarisedimenticolaceae bacterium]|nr:sigma-54 dependent transcriptional regulator [Candidatus Polarisedimenticolaceae bacterium]
MILIVDDDPSVRASLALLLKQHGHATSVASGPDEALAVLGASPVSLVLQDMNFSRATQGDEGLTLLSAIRERHPALPVILITAWGSIPLAVEGMRAGASDFITKPWSNVQVVQSVETALALAAPWPKAGAPAPRRFAGIVGEDPKLLRVLEMVARVAPTDASVLITGESGTGKELIAEAIHAASGRRDGPFVKVNLGGISATLFESEMFGHVRGAFTDARSDRRGRFELADGGTIVLDEIGELDPAAQVKLLRVLQDRTYEALGSSASRSVDVRVVSSTNRDLPDMVAKGTFREDLFYRLNLIALRLPPLRERAGDVRPLAEHFLEAASKRFGRRQPALAPSAAAWLVARSWPGNVRELKQAVERAVLVVDDDRLDADHFRALAELEAAGHREAPLPSPGTMTLDALEKAMIERCLVHASGNLTRAAEALGISRTALYRRLQKHGIEAKQA